MFGSCGRERCAGKKQEVSGKAGEETFDQLIANTFRVGKQIGAGSYGQIRLGTNVRTNQTVAIKFEKNGHDQQLAMESHVRIGSLLSAPSFIIVLQVYSLLSGKRGFPTTYHYGGYLDYQVLVMEVSGSSISVTF